MTMQAGGGGGGGPSPSGLADVIDTILDKGLVIDAYVRVSLVGIEVLTIDARVVIASVDTYLRFAEAVGRLELGSNQSEGLPEMLGHDRDGESSDDDSKDEDAKDGDSAPPRRRPRKVESGSRQRAIEPSRSSSERSGDGGGEEDRGL